MRIEIWIEEREPPNGYAQLEDGRPRPFQGWLGLMQVISELLAASIWRREGDHG